MKKRNSKIQSIISGRKLYLSLVRLLVFMLMIILATYFAVPNDLLKSQENSAEFKVPVSRTLAGANSDENKPLGKNETVYGILLNDGSIKSVEIVNHVYLRSKAYNDSISWTDHGRYSEVINLLDDRQPHLANLSAAEIKAAAAATGLELSDYDDMQSLIWNDLDADNWQDLYYQGTSLRKLPWSVSLEWALDGTVVEANALAGANGRISLKIDIADVENYEAVYHENYMLQITVPLPLSQVKDVQAGSASSMIAGRTRTLAYTVLPGQTGSFELSFTASDFSMEPIQITALPAKIDMQGFESMTDGISRIREGQSRLAEGTTDLSQGMTDYLDGLNELNDGVVSYTEGGEEIAGAMSAYDTGLSELEIQMNNLVEGASAFASGLDQYSESGQQILQGYAQFSQQLSQLRLSDETTAELQQLVASPDQLPDGTDLSGQKNLASSLLALDTALGDIKLGLEELNDGLGNYVDGAAELSGQYAQIYSGVEALGPAASELADGFGQINYGFEQREQGLPGINEGLNTLTDQGSQLPAVADELSSGQLELAAGLLELEQAIDALVKYEEPELVSYAAPGLITPESVQFLIVTEGIS